MIVTINGQPCQCQRGEYLLAVAQRNGVEIPTLCHHSALAGQGSCRLCIVEVTERGRSRVVTACVFPIEDECSVETDSPRIREQRGMILALLRCRAPESAQIAALCQQYQAPDLSRFQSLDSGACVLCGLCVKACAELGSGAINTMLRGTQKQVSTPYDEASPDCIGCTSCAEVCPTGHIRLEQDQDQLTIWGRSFPLVRCPMCGQPMGTAEALAYAAEHSGQPVAKICPDCRRRLITNELAHAYGRAVD